MALTLLQWQLASDLDRFQVGGHRIEETHFIVEQPTQLAGGVEAYCRVGSAFVCERRPESDLPGIGAPVVERTLESKSHL